MNKHTQQKVKDEHFKNSIANYKEGAIAGKELLQVNDCFIKILKKDFGRNSMMV